MKNATIWILLPVYNGANYLAPMLDSVLAQTHGEWILVCRDDGSTDESPAILSRYAQQNPDKVLIDPEPIGNIGVKASFSHLMNHALVKTETSHHPVYFALADQDDLWLPQKLEKLLANMQVIESSVMTSIPVLIHSDLRVVDQDGAEMAPSFVAYQGLKAERHSFSAQLISNTLTGCTALMNRPLLALSTPVHPESIMHDWWISLVASAFGRRFFVPESLIDYRQHANNTIGAKAWHGNKDKDKCGYRKRTGLLRYPQAFYHFLRVFILHSLRLCALMFRNEHNPIFQANARQAKAFAEHFGKGLSARDRLYLWLTRGLSVPFPPLQLVLFRVLRRA
jgi:glycosyltransferase involved in cell wall biosynthesis